MLIQEALYFKDKFAALDPTKVFPMCNVGSSTKEFREKKQPYIDDLIFNPLVERGCDIIHMDVKSADGVDLVGDLGDPVFLNKVSKMKFNSVFCSNLLEHVENRIDVCSVLLSIIPSGGYLFISVPFSYPYHPDPIDTGFRPGIEELAALFPDTRVVCSDIVGDDTILGVRRKNIVLLLFTVFRVFSPFYKPVLWWRNKCYFPWFFRKLTATCVILQKK